MTGSVMAVMAPWPDGFVIGAAAERDGSVTVEHPLLLIGLVAVPAAVWLAWHAGFTSRRERAAAWARATAIALLVLALADPRVPAAGEAVDVAFLLDASDSVGAAGRAEALAWVQEALGARPADARAALATFGADARLEYTLTTDPPTGEPATAVDASASDLARALRLAQGVLGSQQRRRAVLLTDGRQTRGDAVGTAEELAAAGIAVDVVSLAGGLAGDVLVEEVAAPSRVRQGESFDVATTLRNTGTRPADAVVTVRADGRVVQQRTVTVGPGTASLSVRQTAQRPGTIRYEVTLASGASTITANDAGRTAVQVQGPPSVLIAEGGTGRGRDLQRTLQAAGIRVERRSAARGLPALDRLLDHDAVALVDVPREAFNDADLRTLDAYVRDAAHGLVAVGGEHSFGVGGYEGTPLEELLPVFARVTDPKRRPSVAEALVVDVSGSMAACHCQDRGFGGDDGLGGPGVGGLAVEGGVNKTDISKEAVARAVDALEAQDTVGVLAFNTESDWVVPLQQLPPEAVVDAGLARLHPEGGTSIPQAVREAIAGLKDVQARLRHIVLFTDGFTEQRALIGVAREAAQAGITLSVVGTGEGAGQVLRDMATAGGGRYYPGRDLQSIPDIIVAEVQMVARPVINEGRFLPVVTGRAPATDGLESAPPLLGYLATTAKPTARTLLAVGAERDPLLATWRAGLGTTVAWTSDASPRWSAPWLTWERFSRFWADVVKSTFPPAHDPSAAVSAVSTTEGVRVRLESADPLAAEAAAVATVTAPDGKRSRLELDRSGLHTFEGSLPGGGEGVYAVSVDLTAGDAPQFRDTIAVTRSYSPEYGAGPTDAGVLRRIAQVSRGRLDPPPETAFQAEGLPAGAGSRSLNPWLALAALVLLPIDVGLRRLRLERGDLRRFRPRLPRRTHRPLAPDEVPPAPASERGDGVAGLLEAKRRARRKPDRPR